MCNKAAVDFLKEHLRESEVKGKSVLEVGSCNINGSARPALEALGPAAYIGVDITEGPGVDRICGVNGLVKCFGSGAFDLVVCTEVMEHVRDWRGAVSNLKNVLKPGGVLLLTTRSPGFAYHGWPHDFWRYDTGDMRALFSDFAVEAALPDPSAPGVFLKASRPTGFIEKDLAGYELYSVLKKRRADGAGPLETAVFMVKNPVVTVFPRLRRGFLERVMRLKRGDADPGEAEGVKAPCDFCGGRDFEFLFGGRDYLAFSPSSFNVERCRGCRAVCMNPSPGDILPYYGLYRKGAPDSWFVGLLSPDRVKLIRELKPGGKALDVGCGGGGFLSGLKESGWEAHGCDISPEACVLAAGESGPANIHNCGIEALDIPEGSFDLITFWHSLEHLERPREALEKAVRLLKEDGILVIESPDFFSPQARFFKDRWFMLDLPRHQYQLEPENLESKLSASGLRVFRKDRFVNPAGTFVSLKKSLLRYSGLERVPVKGGQALTGLRRARAAWALLRFFLDAGCAAAALLLVLLGREDTFRIYCKKAVKP